MKTRRMVIAVCLAAMMPAWAQTVTEGDVWTMDRCIDYAMTHATDIRKKKVEADNARQDRGAAMGDFIPSLAASVGGQFSWGRNVDPETNTYNTITTFNNNYSVGTSIAVFDGAQTWNAFRKARLAVRQSDNALLQARDEKAIEVMERYVDAVYAEASRRMTEDKLADSRLLLDKTRRMEELGEKSYPDVAQIEAQVAEDEYSLQHQMTVADKAMVELRKSMGMESGATLRLACQGDGGMTAAALGLADSSHGAGALGLGGSSHGAGALGLGGVRMAAAEMSLSSARLDYKIACGRLWPTLSVGGGISTGYYKNLSSDAAGTKFSRQLKDNLGEYVYASLSIPLFDFKAIKNVKKARNNVRLAEIEREEMRLNVNSDYRQAVIERDGYAREVELMERKVASDSIAHHLNTRKYEEGMLSTFDLHTSAQTLHDSRVKLLQTRMMAVIKKRLVEWYEK